MKLAIKLLLTMLLSAVFGLAAQKLTAQTAAAQSSAAESAAPQVKQATGSPSLTIYNANFAVVRQNLLLDLGTGINHITFADATAHIEPDSVILRDLEGKRGLQVLEQNYRNDPVSQALLLSLFEGKTIQFQSQRWDSGHWEPFLIPGKVIRSGYTHNGNLEPIIEVDGKLQFSLPGQPVFPALGDNTILKPTLDWLIQTDKPGASNAEVGYVTGGFSWHADYNLIAPVKGDTANLVGWITMDNQSGKTFENAQIKLMAGDVNKLQPQSRRDMVQLETMNMNAKAAPETVVTEKAFDEFHLYTLAHATTLLDHETKQVEFVSAPGMKSQKIYVYNGAAMDTYGYGYYGSGQIIQDPSYGTQSNAKVWVMQEFKNSKANGLGIPLPKGRLRFYRRDDDGQLQFVGENTIDHTPTDETVRVYTGNSFDLVGERRRTNYRISTDKKWIDESFEIKVRNHKKEAAEIRVVERLYRCLNWQIAEKSNAYRKLDAQTVEYRVEVPPDGEQVVNYTVHYSW